MGLQKSTVISSNELPDEIHDEISEWLSDYLSDKYGYCHKGFSYEIGDIKVSNIKWDTSD